MALTRWQRRMLKIDGLMAHAAACERNLTVTVRVDTRKLMDALNYCLRTK